MPSITVFDADGTVIPGADLDEMDELEILDPEGGEPLDWPAWTDADRWVPTDPDDLPSLAAVWRLEPSREEELDRLLWSDRLETLASLTGHPFAAIPAGPLTEADIAAAGLAIG